MTSDDGLYSAISEKIRRKREKSIKENIATAVAAVAMERSWSLEDLLGAWTVNVL